MITKYTDYCILCGRPTYITHHCIEGTANRKKSDEWGLTIPLCPEHHNMSDNSVHLNPMMQAMGHIIGQLEFEKQYILRNRQLPFDDIEDEARENFRKEFGKSYL